MTTPNTPLRDAIAETIYYDQPFYDSGEVLDNHQVIPHDPVPFEALLNFGEHGRKWEEACYKLADQILALLDVREWRPTSSPPKKGERVLIQIGTAHIEVAEWDGSEWMGETTDYRMHFPRAWQPLPLPQPPQTQDAGDV